MRFRTAKRELRHALAELCGCFHEFHGHIFVMDCEEPVSAYTAERVRAARAVLGEPTWETPTDAQARRANEQEFDRVKRAMGGPKPASKV